METLNFSYNWNNKLSNSAFTTLRRNNPSRHEVGKAFQIILNGQVLGTAVIRRVHTLQAKHINDFVSYLDTGYSPQQTLGVLARMYPDMTMETMFDLCLMVYQGKPEAPVKKDRDRAKRTVHNRPDIPVSSPTRLY